MKKASAPRTRKADFAAENRRLREEVRALRAERDKAVAETREALEKQIATAEMLHIISSSPTDLQPTFDAIAARATALSGAAIGVVYRFDGSLIHLGTLAGLTAAEIDALQSVFPLPPSRGSATARAILIRKIVHIPDPTADPEYPHATFNQFGTVLSVPMMRVGTPLGAITVSRRQIEPFSEAQIALVQTFADQAVIAIETARLITETREALEQQTATAQILQIINSSPGDLAPVFDAILEKAHARCDAPCGSLQVFDGELFRAVATRGLPEAYAALLRRGVRSTDVDPGAIVQFDFAERAARSPDNQNARIAVEVAKLRTVLFVPLRKDDVLVGRIAAGRQEARPFSDKQIALLQNFAAQAVIAMENARLLEEIRQREAELRVTFDNMGDGVVMFDAELRLAAWNKNFQELLDLPDDFLAEPHRYDDFIRYLGVRGEYGEVDPDAQIARLRERSGDHYSFERTRPDGTIIEVRHNPMPEGGFVLIYSDITERKRSETEIREARDAAEGALRELKTAQASLIQAEKMASLGQLTAGIAHEIKNPLNFVNNFASLSVELLYELKEAAEPAMLALGDAKREQLDETVGMLTGNLEKIVEHGRRADNIVKSVLEHSRSGGGERREVDLNNLVEDALNLAYHGARAQDQCFNISLEREFDPALTQMIELAPQEMTRVFLNLFGNGFYAANRRAQENGDGSFRPLLTVKTRDAGDAVEIRVRDNGNGIPPEIKDKLFQPFFTTKPTGEGTGLGLSISYDIVTQQHGGTIEVDSRVGEFTEFTIRLPRP
jgi:two-component system, NtrC family, sensor kinase